MNVFFRLHTVGLENIPKSGGFILASNHVSYFDPVVVGSACPRDVNYMAKHDLFSNGVSSWFLFKLKAFPVKRGSSDIWALKEAIRRVKKGGGLLLFPEGRRIHIDEKEAMPEAGVGFLANKLNVPVIPVHVKGTETVLPKAAKFITFSKISVTFGKQILLDRNKSHEDIAQSIMNSVRELKD